MSNQPDTLLLVALCHLFALSGFRRDARVIPRAVRSVAFEHVRRRSYRDDGCQVQEPSPIYPPRFIVGFFSLLGGFPHILPCTLHARSRRRWELSVHDVRQLPA